MLVLEDHPGDLRLLKDALQKEGLEVVGCTSTRFAFQHLRQLDFGLAVLDVELCNPEGTQLLNQLRTQHPSLPVMMFRSPEGFPFSNDPEQLDHVVYLEKTGDYQELLRHIHRILLANYDRYTQELEQAIEERTKAKREVQRAHDQLTSRMKRKTAEWGRINHALQEEAKERQRVEAALLNRKQQLHQAIESRETLCQNLHDGVLQLLYVISLDLKKSKPLLQQDPQAARHAVSHAIGLVNSVMREIRSFIACHDQQVRQEDDFHSMVETVVKQLTEIAPLKCEVSVDPDASQHLTKDQTFHLAYIVKEAISNSLRHGKATTVGPSLRINGQSISLQIRDNGVGFSMNNLRSPGYGLRNIALRTKKIGGHLLIDSKPSQGTSIMVNLPRAS